MLSKRLLMKFRVDLIKLLQQNKSQELNCPMNSKRPRMIETQPRVHMILQMAS